jgi:hypothetical protein
MCLIFGTLCLITMDDKCVAIKVSGSRCQNKKKFNEFCGVHKPKDPKTSDIIKALEGLKVSTIVFKKSVFTLDESMNAFAYLKQNINWIDGIKTRTGQKTRKAMPLNIGDVPIVDTLISTALTSLTDQKYEILGIYLNYYESGEMWTPNHSHPGTSQLVISLGQTRTLLVDRCPYIMDTGSAIIFGSEKHGVPKDSSTGSRISIATFMIPVGS